MGLYLSTYAGPVLLCWKTPVVINEEVGMLCKNPACEYAENLARGKKGTIQRGKFCSECGRALFTAHQPTEDYTPSHGQVAQALVDKGLSEDSLVYCPHAEVSKDCDVYLANSMGGFPRDFSPDNPDYFNLDIGTVNIEHEKELFEAKYAAEIDVMRSVYEAVGVNWCFINYES